MGEDSSKNSCAGCAFAALASRCLQLVVHYIPVIRAHFETKLQPRQFSVLRHFDHITKVTQRNHLSFCVKEDSRETCRLLLYRTTATT